MRDAPPTPNETLEYEAQGWSLVSVRDCIFANGKALKYRKFGIRDIAVVFLRQPIIGAGTLKTEITAALQRLLDRGPPPVHA